ncbi:MAG: transglutaminase domain-containing protein [Prevotella sp.]|nr:transglutaminase domain-containing protein [Prevotella sp.]MBR3388962.1 transglutaminase domain-containing protein [Prevotella sp.]
MKKKIFIFTICLSVMMGAQAQKSKHFISDDNYREKTEKAFNEKMQLIGKQFFDTKKLNANERELEALKFLYAYMALADATDYPTSFFYDNVKCSFTAQKEMPWGVKIPELLFRHFVLPVRVNNENLDESRMVFYKDLKERVKGMSMKEAILEVNHWCHERVTYQPSDARTSSPLASIRTAYGRCGEESTFTVAALRSIGIPARQVYTPRWAHTDDNHAWVEAWADGEWYFLGACEPEAVLNLGWFNAPASRAMLMHTRAFGDYNGPEEAVLRTNNYTEINLIDNYATTERIDFRVVDTNGKAVNGARVDFKIYNYAEYYTAVTKYTDERGETFLTAGLGDLIVWASHEGRYGFTKASFGKDKHITITLSRSQNSDLAQRVFPVEEFDIVPPPEKVNLPDVPEDMQKRNKERFAYEDSIRNAYVATFISQETASNFPAEATPYLIKARGNWQTILAFLEKYSDRKERAYKLLSTLSDKDLRDMQMDILDDNMNATSDQLCPRVENEMIILPFKQFFEKAFDKKTADRFRKNPSELVGWVKKNIRLNPDKKAIRIAQTPVGVWRSRVTDTRSRDIFFVDVARSLGIEAQKDGVTSKVQYKQDGKWVDVNFDATEQASAPQGTLMLGYTPTKMVDDPKYYSHFTISRIDNGTTSLLSFDEGQVDMGGGVSWSNTFKNGTLLDEGTYELVTGMRLANGTVLSTSQIFNIRAGETTNIELTLRSTDQEVSVIGSFDSESKFLTIGDKKEVSILSQTGRGYFIVGLIGVGQEPTNHALRDIAKVRKSFEAWGRPILLLFENEEEARKFNKKEFGELPNTIIYGIDKDGAIKQQIVKEMKLQSDRLLPIFFTSDTFNRVVSISQGYTIGLGEQLEKIIKKL